MDDLISRSALLNECAECQKTDPYFDERGWASHFINDAGEPSTEWYCVEDMIENAPAVDAVLVVRCKDCKHVYFASNRVPEEQCWVCDLIGLDVTEGWYCADGERRENDD